MATEEEGRTMNQKQCHHVKTDTVCAYCQPITDEQAEYHQAAVDRAVKTGQLIPILSLDQLAREQTMQRMIELLVKVANMRVNNFWIREREEAQTFLDGLGIEWRKHD
jgi:hypothetical protein